MILVKGIKSPCSQMSTNCCKIIIKLEIGEEDDCTHIIPSSDNIPCTMSNMTRGADAPHPGSDFHLLGQRKGITGEGEEVSEVGDNLITNKKWWRVTFLSLPKRTKWNCCPPFKEHCPWIWRLPSRSPCHPSSFSGHEFSRTRKRYPFNYHPHGGPYKYV